MTRTISHCIRIALVLGAFLATIAVGWLLTPNLPATQQHQAKMLKAIVGMLDQNAEDHKAQLEIMRDIRQSLRGGHRLAALKESRHEDPQPE